MKLMNSCKKMALPNGKVVDILSTVFEEIGQWLQDSIEKTEAGGYIVGYQHCGTKNITLEHISHPYLLDIRERLFFVMRDPRHKIFLSKHRRKKVSIWEYGILIRK